MTATHGRCGGEVACGLCWAAVPAPAWHPWPARRPAVRVAFVLALLAPLALALALALLWVPGTSAYGQGLPVHETPATAPAPTGPPCTLPSWQGPQHVPYGCPPPPPGPGNQCTEDMPCWCVAHGLPASQCTTATLPWPVPVLPAPVAGLPMVTG